MLVSQKLGGMGRQPPERITEAATQGAATRGGFRLSGSCPERTATDEAARSPWPPLMWFTAL